MLHRVENNSDKEQNKAGDSDVSAVMSEINENKNSENNMIVYSVKDRNSEDKESRQRYDMEKIQDISDNFLFYTQTLINLKVNLTNSSYEFGTSSHIFIFLF
jgi:hypothetical protein